MTPFEVSSVKLTKGNIEIVPFQAKAIGQDLTMIPLDRKADQKIDYLLRDFKS